MKYTRDLDYSFWEEAKKLGIDIDQLPSGEALGLREGDVQGLPMGEVL